MPLISGTSTPSGELTPVIRINCGGPSITDSDLDWDADTSGSPHSMRTQIAWTEVADAAKTEHSSWPASWPGDESDDMAHNGVNGIGGTTQRAIYDFTGLNNAKTYTVRIGLCDHYSGNNITFDFQVAGTQILDDFDPASDELHMIEETGVSPTSTEINFQTLNNTSGDGQWIVALEVLEEP